MTAALKSIAETVEQLPAKERIYLAERLLASLEDAELEKEWADEASAVAMKSAPAKSKEFPPLKPIAASNACWRNEARIRHEFRPQSLLEFEEAV